MTASDKCITLAAGASRSWTVVAGEDGLQLPFSKLTLEENAVAELCVIVPPGHSADIDTEVLMSGKGARLFISGAFVCGGDDRVNLHSSVVHSVADCTSEQVFCSIVAGNADFGFSGIVNVRPGAIGTQAMQTSRNLQLSDKAKLRTEPHLEIYADDVKCSHGATIGMLDADELFYLQSRGIPAEEAKVLMMLSFLSPVLRQIKGDDRAAIESVLEKAVRAVAI